MGKIYFGNTEISKIYRGNIELNEIYQGKRLGWKRFNFPSSFRYLIVAGGGGGGMDMGGGGGAGGFISGSTTLTEGTSYPIIVGAGGTGAPAAGTNGQPSGHQYTIPATNGGNSSFNSLTAIGGGFGGSSYRGYTPGIAGGNGGSGGGASGYNDNAGTFYGGTATAGQGNIGGNSTTAYYSGGGGGAGGAGVSSTAVPHGGIGIQDDILGTAHYWAGGGGGSAYSVSPGGNGGAGGGGGGAVGTTTGGSGLNAGSAGGGGSINSWTNTPGGNAGANTGGGGGGGSHYNANNKGGDGGSGIVVIRYAGAPVFTGGTITTVGGDTVHTFTSSGTLLPLGQQPSIVTDGLQLHLDVNNPSSYPGTGTTWTDLTGNGYNHTLLNGAGLTTIGGVSCIDCTGGNKYIADAGTTFAYGNNHTMIAWVYTLTDAQVGTWRTLWRTLPDDHPLLIQDGTDTIGYYDNNSAGFVSYGLTAAGTGIAGNWAMISLVGTNGTSTSLYINEGTTNGTVGYNATGNSQDAIGAAGGGSQSYGYIAAVYVYNRALSPSEIEQQYNATKDQYGL